MYRKRIGKHIVSFGVQALTRYKPAQEMRYRRKGENSYNNCLQCSKWRVAIRLSARPGGNRMAIRAAAQEAMCAPVLPSRHGGNRGRVLQTIRMTYDECDHSRSHCFVRSRAFLRAATPERNRFRFHPFQCKLAYVSFRSVAAGQSTWLTIASQSGPKQIVSGLQGHLRVGFVENAVLSGIVSHALREFEQAVPHVTLELQPMNTPEQLESIVAGRLHGGFYYHA
ncbi:MULTISPECIES: LysR substrate-binding domain-containing protein [Paraburkholderia]|uniref:LysR substrate-binding domain-containing protein n=1 Tax=Paraburkholderia unamae TaxID=219649 RepID=A0ACC6RTN6_9BURK